MASRRQSPNPSAPRRVPAPQNGEQYINVPQTPYSPPRSRSGRAVQGQAAPAGPYAPTGPPRAGPPPPLFGPRGSNRSMNGNSSVGGLPPPPAPGGSSTRPAPPLRNTTAQDVVHHNIGGGFGPYAHNAVPGQPTPSAGHFPRRDRSAISVASDKPLPTKDPYTTAAPMAPTAGSALLYGNKDNSEIDLLHDPDPKNDPRLDQECDPFSGRGWLNVGAIVVVCSALILLFAGYPIISFYGKFQPVVQSGYNLGGINASGQVPDLPNIPSMIDPSTPKASLTRTGSDDKKYNLIFSDEFNRDGRTFWPGDDPWWEAVDLHYWATGDLEWYTPDAITTKDGNLVITMTEQLNHQLNFQSGMLQSWNKFCFSSGYVEVNLSLPGAHNTPGFWPGAWTMGNLGRAGYGATTEGGWPYSYDACDIGTFPGQINKDGTPTAQETTGKSTTPLSSLPGQKLSACSCPGSDHPGPSVDRGRGIPEIDIIEAQIEPTTWQGEASQSFQIAPFNAMYTYDNSSAVIYNTTGTKLNTYKGGIYQQAVSAVSDLPNEAYSGNAYATYAFEFWGNRNDRANTYITWYVNGVKTWTVNAATVAGDPISGISGRLIPEEPMYLILNLGMAPSFQHQDFANMVFPNNLLIDYVRVYQRAGQENWGCNPKEYPTTDYINDHIGAYTNANFTTWENAGFRFPANRLYDTC